MEDIKKIKSRLRSSLFASIIELIAVAAAFYYYNTRCYAVNPWYFNIIFLGFGAFWLIFIIFSLINSIKSLYKYSCKGDKNGRNNNDRTNRGNNAVE